MRKVLIVSPHFPPTNAPDMQRVRTALPYLRRHGWEPSVLAVEPESIEGGVSEPRLLETFPADIRVVRVRAWPVAATRWLGVGSLWWRSRRALIDAGERLLADGTFDLVFISTTQFGAFSLGPRWRQRFGVPYVLDYQDPWINDYYQRTGTRPPGGALKFAVSQWSARREEPRAVRGAAAIVAVSGGYGEALARRYPWFNVNRAALLPFGAADADFDHLAGYRPASPLVDFRDGHCHHVYVGRGGADMTRALQVLFRAFQRYRRAQPAQAARMRFHFIGTDYAPAPRAREWVNPVARAEGVGDVVAEHPGRVRYFDALYYLRNAGAVVAIGSDDAAYSASKLFPCVLARRPLLVIGHRDSPALAFAAQMGAGRRFGFGAEETVDGVAEDVSRRWFLEEAVARPVVFDEAAFAPFSAAGLTARLAEIFDRSVESNRAC